MRSIFCSRLYLARAYKLARPITATKTSVKEGIWHGSQVGFSHMLIVIFMVLIPPVECYVFFLLVIQSVLCSLTLSHSWRGTVLWDWWFHLESLYLKRLNNRRVENKKWKISFVGLKKPPHNVRGSSVTAFQKLCGAAELHTYSLRTVVRLLYSQS